jgi:hypothetical protein
MLSDQLRGILNLLVSVVENGVAVEVRPCLLFRESFRRIDSCDS